MGAVCFTIYGEAASKANSRKVATIAGKTRLIKSAKAREFLASAQRQVPPRCRVRFVGPVRVTLHLYYASERPDLDEALVLDAMQDVTKRVRGRVGEEPRRVLVQGGVYRNDRQVREKHVYHHIDRGTPRVVVEVEPLLQAPLFELPEPAGPAFP